MLIFKRKVYIPSRVRGSNSSTSMLFKCLVEELEYANCALTPQLKNRLGGLSQSELLEFADRLLKDESFMDAGAPLYYNWTGAKENHTPTPAIDQPTSDVKNKKFGYIGDPKIIELASEEEARTHFNQITETIVQHRNELMNIVEGIKLFGVDTTERYNQQVMCMIILVHGLNNTLEMKTTPSQVLRYLAVKQDLTHWNLPDNVRFGSLSWQTRLEVCQFLDKYSEEVLLEVFGKNQALWKKLFCSIHILNQPQLKKKYPRLHAVALVTMQHNYRTVTPDIKPLIDSWLSNGFIEKRTTGILTYRTFESRVKACGEKGDVNKIIKLMDGRASYLYNNLTMLSSNIKQTDDLKVFIDYCIKVLPEVHVSILLSLVQINPNATYRIIDLKGNTTVQPANYPYYFDTFISAAKKEIHKRLKVDGCRFDVAHDIVDEPLPFLAKNQALVRGSRRPLTNNHMHFMIHWVETLERTDIDHSWVIVYDDGNYETIYWLNTSNEFIRQSGDVRKGPAPDGGTEYSVIDLNSIPKNAKYIIPVLNIYAGDDFGTCKTAYAGFMFNDEPIFQFNSNATKFYLVQNALMNVPFVIDVKQRALVITDYNEKYAGGLASDNLDTLTKLIVAINETKYITVGSCASILSDPNGTNRILIVNHPTNQPNTIYYGDLVKYFKQ